MFSAGKGKLFQWGCGRACGNLRRNLPVPEEVSLPPVGVKSVCGGCWHSLLLTGRPCVLFYLYYLAQGPRSWVLLQCTGLYSSLQGSTAMYRVLLQLTRFYCRVQGSTVVYMVLLCTGSLCLRLSFCFTGSLLVDCSTRF